MSPGTTRCRFAASELLFRLQYSIIPLLLAYCTNHHKVRAENILVSTSFYPNLKLSIFCKTRTVEVEGYLCKLLFLSIVLLMFIEAVCPDRQFGSCWRFCIFLSSRHRHKMTKE